MAAAKRKALVEERPAKKVKATIDHSDTKWERTATLKDQPAGERKPVAESVLVQEDKAFPRGGASVLTPIEQKQIKAQAERDVLFEQQTGQVVGEDDNTELFDGDAGKAQSNKQSKKRKSHKTNVETTAKSSVKISGLSYKTLVIGSVVLGRVTSITSRDVALALANNLTGFVPITSISAMLNRRIEKLLNDDEDGKKDEEDVDLKQIFYIGQWLRATVTATGSEAEGSVRSKRHIELSVDPSQVNQGLDSGSIVTNSMIQASVRSVEDHGLVMDLCLSDGDVKGFISKKDLGTAFRLSEVQEGQVMMCLVTGKGSNGKVLKLCTEVARISGLGEGKGPPSVGEAPAVIGFQPGTAVDILITDSGLGGIAGKVMGLLDVTADAMHADIVSGQSVDDVHKQYKIGSKVKGRIIWTIPTDDDSRRIGLSLLPHVLTLPPSSDRLPQNANAKLRSQSTELAQLLPSSSIIKNATVVGVQTDRGLLLNLPSDSGSHLRAFAHIAQISDSRINTLATTSGSYKIGSTHDVRILSYNPLDGLYFVSLKKSILEQPFLRLEDLIVGESAKGSVEKLIVGPKGVTGILIKLSDSVNGLVPELHISDVQLQHPERKFKEGLAVKARVLNVDVEKRYLRLTLKKSLVGQDENPTIWKDYSGLEKGMESKGTIVSLLPHGAAVQFFGNVRAWLPVAEMSDTYIEKVEGHFRLGQTINVRILSVDADTQEMKVSCKAESSFGPEQQSAWDATSGGTLTSALVTEKNADSVAVELSGGLKGMIRTEHLTDGSMESAEKALKKLRVGQDLTKLVVLEKLERNQHLLISKKSSLVEAAESRNLLTAISDAKEGQQYPGFVRNITADGVFVEFANAVVGLLHKSQVSSELVARPDFGLRKDQSISVWVLKVNDARDRISLTMHEPEQTTPIPKKTAIQPLPVTNVGDNAVSSMSDFVLGSVTKARVASIKGTQLNMRLADNVQGRIDVSEAFNNRDEITNKRVPLQQFKANDVLDVKILGIHDSRNHRFLPISHRQGSAAVFELSAKRNRLDDADETLLTMSSVEVGATYTAFVNNHGEGLVWASLSPNVRGRIAFMDLSSDVGQLHNLSKSFPIGCALEVTVKGVDAATNRLDLVAKSTRTEQPLTLQTISPGMILAGRITKLAERSVVVQLAEDLAAPIPLVEISDDFDELNFGRFRKNEMVRVCVLHVDSPNKRVFLSLRPSKVLSSSLPVKDAQISSYSQLKPGDIVRGFVKHVGEKGVHVALGATVDAFVKISDLSDKYVKDRKTITEVDQLVTGRILSVDASRKDVLLSLKGSHVDADYKAPSTINDLHAGDFVTGKVRKVEDFGAFIDIDHTQRLSGLCHRSEVAAKRVEDVRKLYSTGDVVKAKILSVDVESRKISLGLKASYFTDLANGDDSDVDDASEEGDGIHLTSSPAVADDIDGRDDVLNGGVSVPDIDDIAIPQDSMEVDATDLDDAEPRPTQGLKTTAFDWSGQDLTQQLPAVSVVATEPEDAIHKKRKRKTEIKEDRTGELDQFGAQNANDFERLLLGQPNDSGLWIEYMSLHLNLFEIEKAREVADRALRTINIREVEEKGNIWTARLNLEVGYGDDDTVEEIFKQACQMQDSLLMHEKLVSAYIGASKHDKAEALFERMVNNKSFRPSPKVWTNYASFLMDSMTEPTRARALHSRALQSVPSNEEPSLSADFARLEFRSPQGDPERGRTIFEGLLSEWPNATSRWDEYVDLERSRMNAQSTHDAKDQAKQRVRALYERMASSKMKRRRANLVFQKWRQFEEEEGDAKTMDKFRTVEKQYAETQQAKARGQDG